MPIAQEDNDDDFAPSTLVEKVHQTQPRVVSATNITPIVDTRYEPVSSLIQYTEGSKWTVDYFSQVVSRTSEASPQQINQHPVYQQYINIKNFELNVTNALAYTQATQTNESLLVGSAVVYAGVIPNEGDMFVADIGNGRMGVFTLTEVVRKTQLLEACFEINYSFRGYADSNEQLLKDLLVKTVQTDYFVKEMLGSSVKPFVAEPQMVTLALLQRYIGELVGQYFGLFYSQEFRTFLMPEKSVPVYDHYVVKTLIDILDVREHSSMGMVKLYNIDGADNVTDLNIWSILLNNQYDLMPVISRCMWLVDTKTFNKWPLVGSIYHSGLDSVVFPLNRMPGSYNAIEIGGLALYDTTTPSPPPFPPIDVVGQPFSNPDGTLLLPPFITSVTTHNNYVLSPAFYNDQHAGKSIMELLLSAFLKGQAFDTSYLAEMYKDIPNWRLLDKFYQIPLLIILLKIAIRRF